MQNNVCSVNHYCVTCHWVFVSCNGNVSILLRFLKRPEAVETGILLFLKGRQNRNSRLKILTAEDN